MRSAGNDDDHDDDDDESYYDYLSQQRETFPHQLPDGLLVDLVDAVNTEEAGLNITLLVHGGVVSGDLVGVGTWLNRMASDVERQTPGSDLSNALRLVALNAQFKKTDTGRAVDTVYLHLLNATSRIHGRLRWSQAWRIRIASIDGWMLGVPPTLNEVARTIPERVRKLVD